MLRNLASIVALAGILALSIPSFAEGQATLSSSLRNSSTLPLAGPSVTINPWDNHHRYAPIIVPVNSSISFIWNNDDHGVYLLNNDQCPEAFTADANGQEELFPVTAKTAGLANYTTSLTKPGVYYFTCQQGVHCLQGQRLEVTVYDYTQGITGSVAQFAPSPQTSKAPAEAHSVASAGR